MSNETNSQLGIMPEDTGTTQGADKPIQQEKPGASVRVATEQQNAPPPASKEDPKAVDFSDFQEVLGEMPLSDGMEKKSDDKKETPKSDDKTQTKPEDKVDDKGQKPEQQEQQQVPDKSKEAEEDIAEVTADIRKGQKDYSGLTEEEIKVFRRMSQKTFETLKPIYLEHRAQKAALEQQKAELERLRSGALPESYYQHPRAYALTPEFENASITYRKAQMLVEHWQGQLDKLQQGDDEYQEVHIDPSNGNLYVGEPVKATKESIGKVSTFLARTQAQLQQVGNAVNNLAAKHKDRFESDAKQIKDYETASFTQFNTEEGKKNLVPLIKDTIVKVLPESHHNNPLAESYAKALITIQQLGTLVKSLQGKAGAGAAQTTNGTTTQQQAAAKTNAQKAGPTNASMAAAPASGAGDGGVDYNQFLEYTGRRG